MLSYKVLLYLAFLCIPTLVLADDYTWSSEFGYPGFNGGVCNAVVFNGDLVVTGNFGANGNVAAPFIARWDGTQWHAMGDPGYASLGGFGLGVYQGELYASGDRGGGLGALSKWDGSQWIDVAFWGDAVYNFATRMIEYNNLLIVTGFIDVYPNGHGITGWDGSGWVNLGDCPSLNAFTFEIVSALTVYDGDLIVGGNFSQSVGSTPMNGLARWDGTTWSGVAGRSALGQPLVEGLHNGGSSGETNSLAVHNGKLVIGGAFTTAGDLPANNIVTFDASTELFEDIGGAPSDVQEVSRNGVSLLAAIYATAPNVFELREYNGSTWSSVGFSDGPVIGPPLFSAMLSFGGDHVLVGDFHEVGATSTPSLATWNGSALGTLANASSNLGLPRRARVMEQHNGELIVAVEHGAGALPWAIVAFDGGTWRYIGRWADDLISDLASDGTSLYASGRFDVIGSAATPNIARWDGTSWHAMGATPPWDAKLAIHDGTVYAGTSLDVSYFDGSAWQSISVSQEGAVAMTFYGGDLIASGYAGATYPLASWDGMTWTPLTGTNGGTLNNVVWDFAVHEGALIMTGGFTEVDGTPARVAIWDGSTLSAWTPAALPDPPIQILSSISVFGNIVVVAGHGGAGLWRSAGLASPWEVLCGGVYSGSHPTLQTFDDKLFVGGDFSVVGDRTGGNGVISSHIACLSATGTGIATLPRGVEAPVTFPNPFNPNTTIRYRVPPGGADVCIVIHDVTGGAIRTLVDGHVGEGQREAMWDGRDDAGNGLASGTYFYRARVGAKSFTGKMTLLK